MRRNANIEKAKWLKEEENVKEDQNLKENEAFEKEKNFKEEENDKEEKSYQQSTFPLNGSEESDLREDSTLVEDLSEVPDSSLLAEDAYPIVYTYQASIQEGLTEEIKTKMAEDVKRSAYIDLLHENDVELSVDDRPIYQMAKKCVCKNNPTNRPGLLSNTLARFNRSIGRISCGRAQGTCFIVAENFVITCFHVYLDFIKERIISEQLTLPIQVAFDFYEREKFDNAVVVEVDESHQDEPEYYYSREFDYIILCLKQSSDLEGRERLGKFVRGYYLHEGLVCITGYPENRELREETCVVVQSDAKKRLKKRHDQIQMVGGIHMAIIDKLFHENPHYVAYDSSLYRGSSGSPGFDMNGKIVLLNAQHYILDVGGKKHALMQFGINFGAICTDLERRFHIASKFFPDWNLQDDVQQVLVDEDPDTRDSDSEL